MKSLIFFFWFSFLSINSIDKEISIYNFVLDDLVNFYSIDSVILINEQIYYHPLPDINYKEEVLNIISKKGDKFHHQSDIIENLYSYLNKEIIKNSITKKDIDIYFLDSNANEIMSWIDFYNMYLVNYHLVSFSPIIYVVNNKYIYVFCTFLHRDKGIGLLYKLRIFKNKLTVLERHKTWSVN